MNLFDIDYRFWITVGGAALFKLLTSPWHSPFRAIVTVLAAVFAAWVFTDPIVTHMSWPTTYREPVAALCALMGEGSMRWIIRVTPEKMLEMWKELRK